MQTEIIKLPKNTFLEHTIPLIIRKCQSSNLKKGICLSKDKQFIFELDLIYRKQSQNNYPPVNIIPPTEDISEIRGASRCNPEILISKSRRPRRSDKPWT